MIEQGFNLSHYHFIWYLLGFAFVPRLTLMIFITIYFRNLFPTVIFITGWILAFVMAASENSLVKIVKK
jgi:hypothetical protein